MAVKYTLLFCILHGIYPSRRTIHELIRVELPNPGKCQACGKKKKLDLSNKSQTYRLDLKDWQYLCRSCHLKHDYTEERKQKNSLSQRGKIMSEEARAKISKTLTGRKRPEMKGNQYGFKKGMKPWNYRAIKKKCLMCKTRFEVSPSLNHITTCSPECGYKKRKQDTRRKKDAAHRNTGA